MHLHILGICGTFMAGIAAIAREAGHRVTGSDAAAWPPMSTQLGQLGITVMQGYEPAHLDPAPDVVVVRAGPRVADVLGNRRVQQDRFLLDQHDAAANVSECEIADVVAIEAHDAGIGSIGPGSW